MAWGMRVCSTCDGASCACRYAAFLSHARSSARTHRINSKAAEHAKLLHVLPYSLRLHCSAARSRTALLGPSLGPRRGVMVAALKLLVLLLAAA